MLMQVTSPVSDIQTTSLVRATYVGAGPSIAAEDADDRLVSDLLETTADTNAQTGNTTFGFPAQVWSQHSHPRGTLFVTKTSTSPVNAPEATLWAP